MNRRSGGQLIWITAAAVILILQQRVQADAGLPMLVLVWPGLGLLLVPIIVAEAGVARYRLRLGWKPALQMSAKANLLSAGIGVPITWALMFGLQFVASVALACCGWNPPVSFEHVFVPTVGAAWLPGEGMPLWDVPMAAAVLCLPFYAVSVWIETRVARACLGPEQEERARAWSQGANRLTYGAIIIGLIGWAIWWAVRPPVGA